MTLESLLEHVLVPKHEVVPRTQVQEVLEKYGITLEKLALISVDDPIVTELQADKGDLIKVTRFSHTAGESIYFRLVG